LEEALAAANVARQADETLTACCERDNGDCLEIQRRELERKREQEQKIAIKTGSYKHC
jgi:hypothetical protein